MKLVIFGATGQTGRELTAQALTRGHHVTAVARRPEALELRHPLLTIVRGDFAEQASINSAVQWQDAVLSAIGAPQKTGATSVHADSARGIIAAMNQTGVKRLVCITSGGTNPQHEPNLPFIFEQVFKRIYAGIYIDQMEMEKLVMASALDWTIVRPAALTNSAATGRCRSAAMFALPGGNQTPRADLAAFMLDQLNTPDFVRKAVALAL